MSAADRPVKAILRGPDYAAFRQEVCRADGWRCKICRRIRPLTVHHVVPRSRGRRDVLSNAMALCLPCHQDVTTHRVMVGWEDVHLRTVWVRRRAGNGQETARGEETT
jgi:hypothetical protein